MVNISALKKWLQLAIEVENYSRVYNVATTPIFDGYEPIISYFVTNEQNAWDDNAKIISNKDESVTYLHNIYSWFIVRINIIGAENSNILSLDYANKIYNSVHRDSIKSYLNNQGILYKNKTNLTNVILYGEDPTQNIFTKSFDIEFSYYNTFEENSIKTNKFKYIDNTREVNKRCLI